MSVQLYEKVESRNLTVDRNTAGFTARFLASGSTHENEIYQAAVLDTTASYFGTLWRSAIRVVPRGNNEYWDVEIDYAPIPPREAILNPNLDGSGEGPPPPVAPDPSTPIGPGFSFSTIGGTTKIVQSVRTRSITRSLAAIAGNMGKQDFHGAINVTPDGVEGVDIVSRTGEFQVEVRRANVTLAYFTTIFYSTGCTNDAPFYGFDRGEVLYLGAEARYSVNDQWQITHKFAVEPNQLNLVVSRDENFVAQLTVPEKRGWDYLWVNYYDVTDTDGAGLNYRVKRPRQAFVEQVYETANFAALEIGA